ncbi:MAG: TadE/TadG family type IV pilus assembly protein [Terracidiphilus sp.]|jgi:Flp pilus assembly protein TadG
MKIRLAALGRRALKEESGQVFVITGLGVMLLVGLAGLAIEVGHGYYALELLQASTNEATLAAAVGLPSATQATTYANDFSSKYLQNNAIGILQNAAVTVAPFCSTTVATTYGVNCVAAAAGDTPYNAVKVTQTATTGLWIGPMFHTPLFNLEAIGTAAMDAETCKNCNIALIMDTTGSMGDSDSAADCTVSTKTSETCALQGFRSLLGIADPCYAAQTCTSSTATPDDVIALYVFPTITTGTVGDDTVCSTSKPVSVQYSLPAMAGSTTYQIIPFSSGATYRVNDSPTTGLNSTDPLVYAAGGSTGQCSGLNPEGGQGTYYAQVMYQAAQDLQAEQVARPGSQNIMILLSDGNATATEEYNTNTVKGVTTTTLNTASGQSEMVPSNTTATAASINGTKVTAWSAQQNIYTYPSNVGQCGQAVQAALDIATKQTVTYTTLDGTSTTYTLNNGTDASKYTAIYTIAFGSPNKSLGSGNSSSDPKSPTSTEGCYTDIPYNANSNYWAACTAATCTATVTTSGGDWPTPNSGETGIAASSPCAALGAMASNPKNFYSDKGDTASPCPGSAVNSAITSLQAIFTQIFDSLGSPKLIPLGTT